MSSIQRRLSFGLFAVLLIVGLGLAQTSAWLVDLGVRRYLENSLRDDTESLLTALVRGPSGVQLDEQRLTAGYQRPFSGHYFRVDFSSDVWRSRSLWDFALEKPAGTGLKSTLDEGPEGQRLLVYRADYKRYGQALSITVAEDYSPVLESIQRFQLIALVLGGVALLLILVLQRWIVRRSLKPLEQVRLQIAQLQQGQRNDLDAQVPSELEPLVRQVNHLLQHTEETLKRSRNALGNLGHALKTPLAVLMSLANREELRGRPELQGGLREQLELIEQRLARELGRARLAGDVLPGAHFECAAELPALFSTLEMIHDRGLSLEWEAPPMLRLPWDREDVLELLGNLLDNACKWAERRVSLSIEATAEGYRMLIDDDGPGVSESRRNEVLERGVRLDEQVTGHGLGLGIVRDIVDSWQGRLQLQDSPLGGLRVNIELPTPRR